jgi:hypothetical protein
MGLDQGAGGVGWGAGLLGVGCERRVSQEGGMSRGGRADRRGVKDALAREACSAAPAEAREFGVRAEGGSGGRREREREGGEERE